MEVSGTKLESFCEPCQDEHVNAKADGVCQECKEYMCNRCFRYHLKARLCRNHVLIDSNPALVLSRNNEEKTEQCKHHENETIKYYCRKHDIVGCGDCMVCGHGACKPEFIKELSKDFQENEEFKSLFRELEILTSANTKIGKAIQDNKKELEKMHQTALKEICKFRTDINNFLDKAEDDVKTEINSLKSDNEYVLTKLKNDCNQLSFNIDKLRSKLDTKIYQGSSLFIQTVESRPEIDNMQRALDRMQSESRMKNFNFVPDKQLLSILASGGNLWKTDVAPNVGIKQMSEESSENMTDQASGWTRQKKKAPKTRGVLCVGKCVRPRCDYSHIKQGIKNRTRASKKRSEELRIVQCPRQQELPSDTLTPVSLSPEYLRRTTAEELALHIDLLNTNASDDEGLKNKIKQIMELTGCSQDTAEIALYDNSNDLVKALNEVQSGTIDMGEWRETGKRTKRLLFL